MMKKIAVILLVVLALVPTFVISARREEAASAGTTQLEEIVLEEILLEDLDLDDGANTLGGSAGGAPVNDAGEIFSADAEMTAIDSAETPDVQPANAL